ncbi:hypothetical protein GQ53DRAFT_112620 [Thozetella sp. PMI_491]|nr:hypothetical protein GQ53DRAFT_112620 [Thozetella sp. PMI_491]
MAEQDAFEDELFADLYADDEPAKGASTEATRDAPSAAPPAASENVIATDDTGRYDPQDQNGDDSYMNQDDYEDDDDEVAFNLGNDASAHHEDTPTHSAPPILAAAAAAVAPPSKGPNAKEDGGGLLPVRQAGGLVSARMALLCETSGHWTFKSWISAGLGISRGG